MIKAGVNPINESNDNQAFNDFAKKCRNNPTYKKAAAICKKYHYQIAELCYVRDGYVQFNVVNDRKKMQPEIYYGSKFGSQNPTFEIMTTSYGSLNLQDYAQFLESCNNAYNMCKELSKLDLTTLENANTSK